MFRSVLASAVVLASAALPICAQDVQVYLTNPDRSALFAAQKPLKFEKAQGAADASTITVDPKKKYQEIDGFGWALTGGSAQLIMQMSQAARTALLKELYSPDGSGIGSSYVRISVGASDMNDHVFSYDDLPAGETDPTMAKFDLGEDKKDVIPVMKEILAINPKIGILASPWSGPTWMKDNNDVRGGKLKPELQDAYALYLVKYIQAMAKEGIHIDTITMQNEPENNHNTPSMVFTADDQNVFLRDHFGPALKKAGLKTKVVLFDHNVDHPEYPMTALKDPKTAQYAAGSGFHLYRGTIDAMGKVHDAFPNKPLYFTEQMVVDKRGATTTDIARPVDHVEIGALRNWSRNVLLWNLAADPHFGPHTGNGGCPICEGAITLDGDGVTRNLAYYTTAHFSKFVRPGSVRVDSNLPDALSNVAFKAGSKWVLVVANTAKDDKSFHVQVGKKVFAADLKAGAAATYVW